MKAQLNEQSVIEANAQFWEQMLAMKLEVLPFSDRFCTSAGHMLGSVDLAGVWKGRIEVRMCGALAYEATAVMMMQAVDSVREEDALDATREIANIIAGTIKSSLPRPCSMTIPHAGVVREEFSSLARTEDSLAVIFRHAAGNLMVRILEHGVEEETR